MLGLLLSEVLGLVEGLVLGLFPVLGLVEGRLPVLGRCLSNSALLETPLFLFSKDLSLFALA